MSILIICILITGLGILSIISHLWERKRMQRKGIKENERAKEQLSHE